MNATYRYAQRLSDATAANRDCHSIVSLRIANDLNINGSACATYGSTYDNSIARGRESVRIEEIDGIICNVFVGIRLACHATDRVLRDESLERWAVVPRAVVVQPGTIVFAAGVIMRAKPGRAVA